MNNKFYASVHRHSTGFNIAICQNKLQYAENINSTIDSTIYRIVNRVLFYVRTGFSQTSKRKVVQPEFYTGKCLEKNARYAVAEQCDKYVECTDGEPEEKLCSDGLLFNDKAGVFTFPCTYPIEVNCTTRTRTQPPQVCKLLLLLLLVGQMGLIVIILYCIERFITNFVVGVAVVVDVI